MNAPIIELQNVTKRFVKTIDLAEKVANLLGAIKISRYYEFNENDIIFTIFTDSADLYQSRLAEMNEERGAYSHQQAAIDWNSILAAQKTDYFKAVSYTHLTPADE